MTLLAVWESLRELFFVPKVPLVNTHFIWNLFWPQLRLIHWHTNGDNFEIYLLFIYSFCTCHKLFAKLFSIRILKAGEARFFLLDLWFGTFSNHHHYGRVLTGHIGIDFVIKAIGQPEGERERESREEISDTRLCRKSVGVASALIGSGNSEGKSTWKHSKDSTATTVCLFVINSKTFTASGATCICQMTISLKNLWNLLSFFSLSPLIRRCQNWRPPVFKRRRERQKWTIHI